MKIFNLVFGMIFLFTGMANAASWSEDIATTMDAAVIAAASNSSCEISLGVISFTGDNTAASAIITNITSTAGMYVGMPISFEGTSSSIASIDSTTQITLAANITDAHTGGSGTATNSYDQMLLQVSISFETATDGAIIKLYSTSDAGTTWDTEPFRSVTITDAEAGTEYNWSQQLYHYLYPRIKIIISNPAAESGSDDDITATVKFAGREN